MLIKSNFKNTKMKSFNKGIISSSLGSFWWGVLGTYYFQYISFIGTFEVVVHRCIWTTLILFVTTFLFGKWSIFKKILSDKKTALILFITSIGKKITKKITININEFNLIRAYKSHPIGI